MATREEASALDLMPGVPVVRVLRTVYDSGKRPLEVQESIVAADSHEFRYEVKMR
ncbi:UTRA domain-containing protein [Streptosporangium sp. NPDC000396]|uniref:UTRA domain-containing protein n=1 Tax=Streptosporangium sp. NPDC000396 TaxID=3366185 RepID=UPI003683C112